MKVPARMLGLPLDKHDRIVPWFVFDHDKPDPDFRVADRAKQRKAIAERRCWVCGQRITGPTVAFVIGPMCAVNRNSAEPPCHRECAEYSAQVCPFMSRPKMRRNTKGVPDLQKVSAGFAIERNPGVAAVWITRHYSPFKCPRTGGTLFDIGTPTRILWFAEGRPAAPDEILASIHSGLPALQKVAEAEGVHALAELERLLAQAMELLPT